MGNIMETRSALRIIGLCGLAGILVDLDHAISLFLWQYVNQGISEGRIWHTPLLIISCIGICYLGPRIPGLYSKLVLVSILMATILVLIFSPGVIWRIT